MKSLILRLRTEPSGLVTVWLIEKDGDKKLSTLQGRLYGVMPAGAAEWLAETLAGVAMVDREAGSMEYAEDTPEEKMVRQGDLFRETA